MKKTEQQIKEMNMQLVTLVNMFLHEIDIRKAETKDGMIKIYNVGDNLIRIDIKVSKEGE